MFQACRILMHGFARLALRLLQARVFDGFFRQHVVVLPQLPCNQQLSTNRQWDADSNRRASSVVLHQSHIVCAPVLQDCVFAHTTMPPSVAELL
jgi:hypothetical protein